MRKGSRIEDCGRSLTSLTRSNSTRTHNREVLLTSIVLTLKLNLYLGYSKGGSIDRRSPNVEKSPSSLRVALDHLREEKLMMVNPTVGQPRSKEKAAVERVMKMLTHFTSIDSSKPKPSYHHREQHREAYQLRPEVPHY